MKKAKGITLIALVVTIIIMLVLAGVSLNAIAGDGGLIANAMRASFIQEMTAVQEAVNMWKMGKKFDNIDDISLPTAKIVEANTLEENKRLMGEVGYYRVWAVTSEKPTIDVKSDEDTFKSAGSGEIVLYPGGVQDLYYIDNEVLELENNNKKYLIDARNSMIYSLSGISIDGIRIHSLPMLRMLQGATDAPKFAEAEGEGGIYAGSKWLTDKDGHYIDEDGNIVGEADRIENPYGFQIIADSTSPNVYKLYNNGDLYGKGVKGPLLSTSEKEMDEINQYKWNDFKVPSIIPGADSGNVKIFPKRDIMFVIDKDNYLWAWGSNTNNCLGLSVSELNEYSGKTPVKLKITSENKKVKNVFIAYDGSNKSAFVITEDNQLYACGSNYCGQLGLGKISTQEDTWQKVDIPEVDKIKKIEGSECVLITFEEDNGEKKYYFAGSTEFILSQKGNQTTFTRVFEGWENEIQDVYCTHLCIYIFKKDGTGLHYSYGGTDGAPGTNSYIEGNKKEGNYYILDPNIVKGYEMFCWSEWSGCLLRKNDDGEQELWAVGNATYTNVGLTRNEYDHKMHKLEIPEELKKDKIKEMYSGYRGYFLLSEKGEIWILGNYNCLGVGKASGSTVGIEKTNLKNIKTMYSYGNLIKNQASAETNGPTIFITNDGKMIATGESDITFGEKVYQQNWTNIAKNVKYFRTSDDKIAYIDNENNLYVAGSDSMQLGLGEKSVSSVVIPTFTKVEDENIAGKAKEVSFTIYNTFVLTTDNELWATGMNDNSTILYFGGWEERVNKSTYVKLLDDIQYLQSKYNKILAFTKEGKAYVWGDNIGGELGISGSRYYYLPIQYTLPNEILNEEKLDNILEIETVGWQKSSIVTSDGKLYKAGTWTNQGYDGGFTPTSYFSEFTHKNLTLDSNEKIISFKSINDNTSLILTDKGNTFGYGKPCYLGIGSTSLDYTETQKIDIKDESGKKVDIIQICAGKNFYIAISSDGRVFGTGDNSNGVLGRWKGVSRGASNSRYRTAFEWVECPELEI